MPTEISTAAIPAAMPAALPHASAPCAPCPSRVAAPTSATETPTAMTISRVDGGGSEWSRRVRRDEEHRKPSGGEGDTHQLQQQRGLPGAEGAQAQPEDEGHRQHRLHHRDRRDREGGDLRSRAEHRRGLAEHPPPPLHQPPQAEALVRRAQRRRLVLQHRSQGEEHRPRERPRPSPRTGLPGRPSASACMSQVCPTCPPRTRAQRRWGRSARCAAPRSPERGRRRAVRGRTLAAG